MSELPWKYSWKQSETWFNTIGGGKMRGKIIIITTMICLMTLSYAFSEDNKTIEGEVSLNGIWIGSDAKEGGRAKFTEYRDLREDGGAYGRARLKLDTEKYFMNFDAGDFGYDTQFYRIDGGMWGKFKLDLFYDEIPHNITFGARTPFLGAGHDTLVGTPNPNFPLWNTFDYSILRRQYGGGLKADIIRPFFFDVSFQRENREGIKPVGAPQTSPSSTAFELPEPVQYVTNNLKVSAGYTQKPLFLSLNYIYSDFNNSDTALNLPSNFPPSRPKVFSLPPDNTYHKGAFKGAVNLPFNSKFSANIGFSRGTSDTSVLSLIGSAFKGKVETQNYDFALTSNPVRFLDAKVYYKYYKRNNKSDDPTGVVDIFLDYKISTYGGELGFRLPEQFYLSGGYKYVKTVRNKNGETLLDEILPSNMDNIYFVDLKWRGLDFLEPKVGYEKFDRDVHYRTFESAIDPSKRFAYSAQNRDTFKAMLDIFPLENLNFGLEYRYKEIDYSDTMFGLKSDKRHEVNISADYAIGRIAKVFGYSDYGWIKHRQEQQGSGSLPWEGDQKDRTWGYGIGAEVYVIPTKLTLVFQHDYLKSNGNVDFTLENLGLFGSGGLPPFPAANNQNIDITRWDDYTLYGFKIKAICNFSKSLAASIGYAYERFWYSDAQLNNYNFAPTGGTNAAFLTGAYKDQSYKAHLVFGGLTYKF
jgi:MtrB/PioB family decaheme-associated outer membrane protein